MNDYDFGNQLCMLREKACLSQKQLADSVGVSDKAVSKWENGASKPTTDTLRKLAAFFSVSVEDLLIKRDKAKIPKITKIVITGGPCAGKTTAMSWIQNHFHELGYAVLFVPETATELITGGVAPWTCGSNVDFQKCQIALQIQKEQVFEQAARSMKEDHVLIVCDRGVMDNKAYMTDGEFALICSDLHLNEIEVRDQYDAVFHMVSAAKGAKDAYTTANNAARTETPEQAALLDD